MTVCKTVEVVVFTGSGKTLGLVYLGPTGADGNGKGGGYADDDGEACEQDYVRDYSIRTCWECLWDIGLGWKILGVTVCIGIHGHLRSYDSGRSLD